VLDPDKHVQQCLRLLFETFRNTGSAMATVKAFQKQGLQFPRRIRTGTHKGDLVWATLGHTQVLRILHNPRYAGAFVYGRRHVRKAVDGSFTVVQLSQDEWDADSGSLPRLSVVGRLPAKSEAPSRKCIGVGK
jgi:hypothetical protein